MITIEKKKIGFCFTGSFCTIPKVLPVIEEISPYYDLIPIVSETVAKTDTRFMPSEKIISELERITGKKVLKTIPECEPIGPKKLLDLLVICPCTGNTLAKIAHGITDTSVTMAYKAHRRNLGNVLIGISTNDALSQSAENIGKLMNQKGIYFVPFCQDDPETKKTSAISDLTKLKSSIDSALQSVQPEPVLIQK